MDEMKILIAGLPNAGKTTYIAALNGAIQTGGDFSLSYAGKSSEVQYINKITRQWLEGKIVDHSTDEDPKYIDWPLKRKNGDVITITIPDMKGEMYQDIINNDFNEGLADFCKGSSGVLFFINDIVKPVLKEHARNIVSGSESDADQRSQTDASSVALTIDKVNDVVKAILVLRYLRKLIGDIKLVVAVSSWDEIEASYDSIDNYMQNQCSALYNYVRYHFSDYRFYGVSAQGLKYDNHTGSLDKITTDGKRAYVFTTEKNYDLSIPLEYLLGEQDENPSNASRL